jgi:hypothetical protein
MRWQLDAGNDLSIFGIAYGVFGHIATVRAVQSDRYEVVERIRRRSVCRGAAGGMRAASVRVDLDLVGRPPVPAPECLEATGRSCLLGHTVAL